ncbi:heparanase-like isoform X2 [Mercenaria mercenaria]|uniref:heparanase-like isoform X2 n=1 Tax=Mercenaria mercenaria TaxID=6596 RepID=UPI00234F6DB4|nr:heparanase-like isoform X2 [Mercenaria mercenaria]
MNSKVFLNILLSLLMSCHIYAINVNIDTTKIHSVVNEKFINVAIDSGIVKNHWEKFRPNSTRVKTLAAGLAPSYMRVGGTGADFLIFVNDKLSTSKTSYKSLKNEDSTRSQQKLKIGNAAANVMEMEIQRRRKRDVGYYDEPFTNFTMTASFYDQIHKFVSSVGWDLIFDLNSLLRKPSGAWDATNAIELINYTVQSGYKMGGWELGNEPDEYADPTINKPVQPEQLAKDFVYLRKLARGYPSFSDCEILGPSIAAMASYWRKGFFYSFLSSGGGEAVTAATFHQYYEDGAVAKLEDFYNPDILNILYDEIQTGVNLTRAAGSRAKVWLGETSSAWRGGAPGLSDRYVAGFMWLDKLGMSARDGIDALIRQTFYGGHYSLLDHETCDPNPDYWLTLLYKLLVGNKVLRVTSPDSRGKVRAYAHCTETRKSGYSAGSLTVYVMNLDQSPVSIEFPKFSSSTKFDVYNMLGKENSILSHYVDLNGVTLQLVDDKTLPDLLRPVTTTSTVSIPAMSYSFIVIPDAQLPVCM